jgi:hypothetical protein
MSADKIRKAIKELSKTGDEVYSIVCNVDSVDTAEKTCDCSPVDGKADLLGVRLMAQNQTGFYIIPKIGSIVVVTMINGFTGYVAMFSEVDEIQLNGDNYDGLVRVQELTDKLNNLEDAFNQHILLYNLHTHAGVMAGASSTTPPVAPDTQVLVPTISTELENLTVLHGNGN